MEKEIMLHIVSTQKADGEPEEMQTMTMGRFSDEKGMFTLTYRENPEGEGEDSVTSVTLEEGGAVTMVREGPFASRFYIEDKKRHLCHYGTPYGEMMLGIYTKNVSAQWEDGEGKLEFQYTIDVNGALASENEVKIFFQEAGHPCQN